MREFLGVIFLAGLFTHYTITVNEPELIQCNQPVEYHF